MLLPPAMEADFYPRSPRGERRSAGRKAPALAHFYPRSPRGERRSKSSFFWAGILFLSTLPARGATKVYLNVALQGTFLSTLPARGATDAQQGKKAGTKKISIHAPREGSDVDGDELALVQDVISIHAPREGSDAGRSRRRGPVFCISIHAPREGSDFDLLSAT